MKVYTKKQLLRLRVFLIFESKRRTKYIVKHKIFKEIGENFFFQPRMIPSDPELIKFHNNVTVASGVTFINHDIIDRMIHYTGVETPYHCGCIEVMDNVFIGSNATILSDIRIGPNAIVAAGSVVTKDVKPNTVVAGNPAKEIGTYDDFIKKRKSDLIADPWENFYHEKDQ